MHYINLSQVALYPKQRFNKAHNPTVGFSAEKKEITSHSMQEATVNVCTAGVEMFICTLRVSNPDCLRMGGRWRCCTVYLFLWARERSPAANTGLVSDSKART